MKKALGNSSYIFRVVKVQLLFDQMLVNAGVYITLNRVINGKSAFTK